MEKGFSLSPGYVWNITGITCRFICKSGSANGQREAGMQANYFASFVTNTAKISTN